MSACYAVTSVGVESRSRCHGVMSEVVAMSLAARCKRRSKKPITIVCYFGPKWLGLQRELISNLLRCDIGRGRVDGTCYAVTSVGVESRSRCDGVSPYGASTITKPDGSRMPSENELAGARFQGRHVAQIANKLKKA